MDGAALGISPVAFVQSRTKQLCSPPGKDSIARALRAVSNLESGPSRPCLVLVSEMNEKKNPSPGHTFNPNAQESFKHRAQTKDLGNFLLKI